MPRSRRKRSTRAVVRRKRRKPRQRGGNFWGKLSKFGRSANRWLKKTKMISRSAKIGSMLGVPYVGTAGKVAGMAGYGKRRRKVRRRRRKQRGRGVSIVGGGVGVSGGGIYLAGARRQRGRGFKKTRLRALPITY